MSSCSQYLGFLIRAPHPEQRIGSPTMPIDFKIGAVTRGSIKKYAPAASAASKKLVSVQMMISPIAKSRMLIPRTRVPAAWKPIDRCVKGTDEFHAYHAWRDAARIRKRKAPTSIIKILSLSLGHVITLGASDGCVWRQRPVRIAGSTTIPASPPALMTAGLTLSAGKQGPDPDIRQQAPDAGALGKAGTASRKSHCETVNSVAPFGDHVLQARWLLTQQTARPTENGENPDLSGSSPGVTGQDDHKTSSFPGCGR